MNVLDMPNNFRLFGFAEPASERRDCYQASSFLNYKNAVGGRSRVKLCTYGADYCSLDEASARVPALLRCYELYDEAVESAVAELQQNPVAVFKLMVIREGTLRSLRLSQICYHMCELHAHPVVPEWNLGIYVFASLDAAKQHVANEVRCVSDECAVVHCYAAQLQQLNEGLVAAAIVPTEIVSVYVPSTL